MYASGAKVEKSAWRTKSTGACAASKKSDDMAWITSTREV